MACTVGWLNVVWPSFTTPLTRETYSRLALVPVPSVDQELKWKQCIHPLPPGGITTA